MKNYLYIFLLLVVLYIPNTSFAIVNENYAYQVLKDLGFENIQVSHKDNVLFVALEDNRYRGNYRGAGIALKALSNNDSANDTICLILKENDMPRVKLDVQHIEGIWYIDSNYACANDMLPFKGTKKEEKSYGKVDFVITPLIELDSLFKDYAERFAIDIAPSIEMTPWKGAKFSSQIIIPVYNNMRQTKYYDKIRLGTTILNQKILSNRKLDIDATAGLFYVNLRRRNHNQYGGKINIDYHLNKRIDLSVSSSYTGEWTFVDNSLDFQDIENLSVLGKISYYEPLINCKLIVSGGKYVSDDWGARIDVVRTLAEYNIGAYATLNEDDKSFAIYCSIPLGLKKKMKRYPVRIRLNESLNWEYNTEYSYKKGIELNTRSDASETYSTSNFWNPKYIAKYVKQFLNE